MGLWVVIKHTSSSYVSSVTEAGMMFTNGNLDLKLLNKRKWLG